MARPPLTWNLPVRRLYLAAFLILSTTSGLAFAQSPKPSTGATPASSAAAPAKQGEARLSPAAAEAVQVVNTFMTTLANGQFEAARQYLTPEATVMANGQVLGNRDGYFNGAAKGDSAALRGVQQRELVRREVKAGADLGWVVSEKRLTGAGPKGQTVLVLTETMLLARTAAGWKITHIHWSGRPAG